MDKTGSQTGSADEWKKKLPQDVYHVTREKGTEPPFSGKYLTNKEKGMYTCSNCGAKLFSSDAKYDSGTGWPSFTEAIPGTVEYISDASHGMQRTEVVCAHCKAHLGHVFDDGPGPTCQRYCMNSLSLGFEQAKATTNAPKQDNRIS